MKPMLLAVTALVLAQTPNTPSDTQKDAIAAIEKLDGKVTFKDGAVVMVDL